MTYIERTIVKEDIYGEQDVGQTAADFVAHSISHTKHRENGHSSLSSQPIQNNERISTDGCLPQADLDSITAPYDGMAVSLERYWSEFYGQTERTYEWNNGILEVKPMAKLIQVKSYLWFLNLLRDYLFGNAIAEMTLLETAFQFNIPNKKKVRIPDLAVVLNDNPVPLGLRDNSYKGIFDICVESVSDSKFSYVERDTVTKRSEYAQGGVTEYYILDEREPEDRECETAFYRLGPGGIYQPIQPTNGIIQSTVLPGFQFRIGDLAERPGPLAMLDDSVYQAFTSPLLRSERQRAEREQERAEREQERAEREQERAERAEKNVLEKQKQIESAEKEAREKQKQVDQINAYLKAQGISLPDHLIGN